MPFEKFCVEKRMDRGFEGSAGQGVQTGNGMESRMNILFVGDVVGRPGREFLAERLPGLKREYSVDMCVVNGENAAHGMGIHRAGAEEIFAAGADVITLGNHTFHNRDVIQVFDDYETVIRPVNYPEGTFGRGYVMFDMGKYTVAVINALGRVGLEPMDCPFRALDRVLEEIGDRTKMVLVDFHAEATSEKEALGFYLDGRVSAVVGTHTHVQTADGRVLPNGTGYITDVGMTGTLDSVLGMEISVALKRFVQRMPERYQVSEAAKRQLNGVLVNIDEKTGKCKEFQSIVLKS